MSLIDILKDSIFYTLNSFHNSRSKPPDSPIVKSIGQFMGDRTWRTWASSTNDSGGVPLPYAQNVWVYSAVRAIAQSISAVPLRLYSGQEDDKKLVEFGALYDLMKNPNPLTASFTQIIESTIIYLCLKGEAFWILEGRDKPDRIPSEIWVFDPSRFSQTLNGQNAINGWEYKGGSNVVKFDPHEIIHFKLFNPYDDTRGLSPLASVMSSIEQDYYAGQFNKNFFKDGATVGGMLTTEGSLTDDQYTRLLRQFDDKHKGYGKAHRIAILEGGMGFTEAKNTQKDMEFVKLKDMSRLEILAALKVNEVVLGVYRDMKSYEGIKTAHRAFWLECLVPKMKMIEETLWSALFSKVLGGKVWCEFDLSNVDALREDLKSKLETAKALSELGYPINMINQKLNLGMESVEWGDTWYKPQTLISVNDKLADASSLQNMLNSDIDNIVKNFKASGMNQSIKRQLAIDTLNEGIPNEIMQHQAELAINPLIKLISSAGSYEAVLELLSSAYPNIDTEEIAESFKKAMFLSAIWGRLDV